MSQQRIIMNYTIPPSNEDIQVLAEETFDSIPEEIMEFCDNLVVQVEDVADEALEADLNLDDPFDLILLYRKGSELTPGVEKKVANEDDVLIIFRRPFLDYWCETQEDLNNLLRQLMIEELGQNFDFSDDEIEEMVDRHYQGAL